MINVVYSMPFKLSNGDAALALVVTEEMFDRVCDHVEGVMNAEDRSRFDGSEVQRIREIGHIPLVKRGIKTEPIFELFDIDSACTLVSICRRGYARSLFAGQ